MWGNPNYGQAKRKPVKPALVTAVDMLARQEYSENRLFEKLIAKGYEEDEASAAIARLRGLTISTRTAVILCGRFVKSSSRRAIRLHSSSPAFPMTGKWWASVNTKKPSGCWRASTNAVRISRNYWRRSFGGAIRVRPSIGRSMNF